MIFNSVFSSLDMLLPPHCCIGEGLFLSVWTNTNIVVNHVNTSCITLIFIIKLSFRTCRRLCPASTLFWGTKPVTWTPWCALWPTPTSCPGWGSGQSARVFGICLEIWLDLCLSLFQTAQSDMLVLPLLNIRQSELVLRSDNVFLLEQTGLSPDLLLFRDQLDLRTLQRAGRLRLTLVDHNVLPR